MRAALPIVLICGLVAGLTFGCRETHRPADAGGKVKTSPPVTNCRTRVWTDASQVCPLLPGQRVPSARIRTLDGKSADLLALIKKKPTLLLVYRGGW